MCKSSVNITCRLGRVQNRALEVLQGSGRSNGGKAAVFGLKSGHFRRQSHGSSYSICKSHLPEIDPLVDPT